MSRADDLAQLQAELAAATAEATRLDAAASAALLARDIPAARALAADARRAYAARRELAARVRAGGRPAQHTYEETLGGYAWSRRPS